MNVTPTAVLRALQEMHPDPFVQARVLSIYQQAPGLLDSHAAALLADAYTQTTQEN